MRSRVLRHWYWLQLCGGCWGFEPAGPSAVVPSTGPGGTRNTNEPQQTGGDPQSHPAWHPHGPHSLRCGPTSRPDQSPAALYRTFRRHILRSRLLQAGGALRVGVVIMARPQKVAHPGLLAPDSPSLSGRQRAPRSPHGRHGCGPYFHKSLSLSLSLSLSGRERATRSPHGRHVCGPNVHQLCKTHHHAGRKTTMTFRK